MTDNEIIKALELCGTNDHCHTLNCPFGRKESWDEPCQYIAIKYALDLINRQKAEIEALKLINSTYAADTNEIREIAIKEFAERLKEQIHIKKDRLFYADKIDNLVKEMVGDAE